MPKGQTSGLKNDHVHVMVLGIRLVTSARFYPFLGGKVLDALMHCLPNARNGRGRQKLWLNCLSGYCGV